MVVICFQKENKTISLSYNNYKEQDGNVITLPLQITPQYDRLSLLCLSNHRLDTT